jgi:Holliday junction resolvase
VKETAITRRLIDKLKAKGAWVYKVHGTAMSRAGVPDLLCCYQGRFFAIEVKTARGMPSARQAAEMVTVGQAGGTVLLCQGRDDIDMVIEEVETLRQ